MLRGLGVVFLLILLGGGAAGGWLWFRLPPRVALEDWQPYAKTLLAKGECEPYWDVAWYAADFHRDEAVADAAGAWAQGTPCEEFFNQQHVRDRAAVRLWPPRARQKDLWFFLPDLFGRNVVAWQAFEGRVPLGVRLREIDLTLTCLVPFDARIHDEAVRYFMTQIAERVVHFEGRLALGARLKAADRCSDRIVAYARRFSADAPGPANWRAVRFWLNEAIRYLRSSRPAQRRAWLQQTHWYFAGHFDDAEAWCPEFAEERLLFERRLALWAYERLALEGEGGAMIALAQAYLDGKWLTRSRALAAYWARLALEAGAALPASLETLMGSLTPPEIETVASLRAAHSPVPQVLWPNYDFDRACPSWQGQFEQRTVNWGPELAAPLTFPPLPVHMRSTLR